MRYNLIITEQKPKDKAKLSTIMQIFNDIGAKIVCVVGCGRLNKKLQIKLWQKHQKEQEKHHQKF